MKHQKLVNALHDALHDNGLIGQVIDLSDEDLIEWINTLEVQLNAARNIGYLRRRLSVTAPTLEAAA
jgi:hypothetical protein